jgi:single-strand DNA-binding protein
VAEYIEKFVEKGTLLYIEGSIEYGSYDKNGVTMYTTDIKVQKARVMNRWKDSGGSGYGGKTSTMPDPPSTGDDVPF